MRCDDIKEDLEKRENVITIETPSYRGSDLDDYFDRLSRFDFLKEITHMNVCNNPVGKVHIDPLPISFRLLDQFDISPIAHLTCKNATLSSIQRWLLGADSFGIKNLLIISGDHGIGDYEGEPTPKYMNSVKIIEGVKRYLNNGFLMPDYSKKSIDLPDNTKEKRLDNNTDFTVGGVVIPRRRNEIEYTKKKIEAGVDFLQTQITYDREYMLNFINKLEDEVSDCPPILVSIRPISSLEEIRYIHENIPQVDVPDEIIEKIKDCDDIDSTAVNIAVDMFESVKFFLRDNSSEIDIGLHIIPGDNHEITRKIIKEVS